MEPENIKDYPDAIYLEDTKGFRGGFISIFKTYYVPSKKLLYATAFNGDILDEIPLSELIQLKQNQ